MVKVTDPLKKSLVLEKLIIVYSTYSRDCQL